jgi:hypothetical protein
MSAVTYRIAKLAQRRGYRVDAYCEGVWIGSPRLTLTYTGARFARWWRMRYAR